MQNLHEFNVAMPRKTKEKAKSQKLSEEEYERKVLNLAEKGLTSEKIGEKLKAEGIHPKEYNKKISKILIDKGKYVNPDIKNVEEKVTRVKIHCEKHKQDKRARRDKDRLFAQIRKLKKYFKV